MLTQNHLEVSFTDPKNHISNTSVIPLNIQQHHFDDATEGDPKERSGKWTEEEDELLRKYVPMLGEKQWKKISEFIPGRSSIQCLHRWTKILKPGLVKGPWTAEEDQKLIAWVKAEGPNKWAQCATFIEGRSGKQCRERWSNNLDPDVKKGNWSRQEDELIFGLYQVHGSSWSKISKFIPGRTENAVKNRFYSTLRKLTSDKKKDELERHEDLCLGTQEAEKQDFINFGMSSQPQSALYLLLNEKTIPILPNEQTKVENSPDSKNLDTTAQLSDKQKQEVFNTHEEKVVVHQNMKFEAKNLQETTEQLAEEDFEDNDAMEGFLSTMSLGFKKPHDVLDFDSLQHNIKNFCQANISVYSKIQKRIEAKSSSEPSEVGSAKLNANSLVQVQRPASTMPPAQPTLNTLAPLATTLPPNVQPNLGLAASQMMNRTMPLPVNPALAQGFPQYNLLNNAFTRGQQNFMQTAGVAQVMTQPKTNPQLPWNVPFPGASQQNFARNFTGMPQGFPSVPNVPNVATGGVESDKRVNLLCQHLYSLEMLLAKTKNDLASYENYVKLKEEDGSSQFNVKFENVKFEDVNESFRTRQFNGPRPFDFSNSEYDQILKKTKVE